MSGADTTRAMHLRMTAEEDDRYCGRLRDEFAMAALIGLMSNNTNVGMTKASVGDLTYEVADAMMEARLK